MQRRRFLAAALASLTMGPIARALAADAPDARAALVDAWARARAEGRPLLVIVADPKREAVQEDAWAQVLAYGDDATMARLGQCEVVCARRETVAEVLGLEGAPWMWIVPPGAPDRAVAGELVETEPPAATQARILAKEAEAAAKAAADAKLAALAAWNDALAAAAAEEPACGSPYAREMAHMVLEQSRPVVADRDAQSVADIAPFVRQAGEDLRGTCAPGEVPAYDRLAAVAAEAERTFAAADGPARLAQVAAREARALVKEEERLTRVGDVARMIETAVGAVLGPLPATQAPALTARGIATCRAAAPPNTRWGTHGACASTWDDPRPEDPDYGAFLCGMAHVPARSARFLAFFAG